MKMRFLEKLRQKARSLKGELNVVIIAYRDKRTPVLPKLLIGITVAYMLSPIDLIPDFIPVIGLLDDLIIIPFLIALSLRLLPKEVLTDAREKAGSSPWVVERKSWVVAILIVLVWAAALYFGIKFFASGR